MFNRILSLFQREPIWPKVVSMGLVLFFIYLADAVLSFWIPGFFTENLNSPFIMGLVISTSSLVGILVDSLLPQVLHRMQVKSMLWFGIALCALFALALIASTYFPLLFIFLVSMIIWGIYYEFLRFAEQQFVADATPIKLHSAAWGIISTFHNLAYFLGPLIAVNLFVQGNAVPPAMALIFIFLAALTLLVSKKTHHRPMEINVHEVSLKKEMEHWRVLFKHVWPVLFLTLYVGIVDATFWTIGALVTENLAGTSFLGGLFLPMYIFPSILTGLFVTRWKKETGKKKTALSLVLISSALLVPVGLSTNIILTLLLVFFSSTLFWLASPLTDAVYSDIIARMGRHRHHLIGLSRSSMSFAYVIGPILAGFLAQFVGELKVFSFIGIAGVILTGSLLLITPKKLHLPQQDIKQWSE